MKKGSYTYGLTYDLILRAVAGEENALGEILKLYEPFIVTLVSTDVIGLDGKVHQQINEDWKSAAQIQLVKAIKKWEFRI